MEMWIQFYFMISSFFLCFGDLSLLDLMESVIKNISDEALNIVLMKNKNKLNLKNAKKINKE